MWRRKLPALALSIINIPCQPYSKLNKVFRFGQCHLAENKEVNELDLALTSR